MKKRSVVEWKYIILKYRYEIGGFLFSCVLCFYIEFGEEYYLYPIFNWSDETCAKLNSLLLQVSIAYVASFIFFVINIASKEIRKYTLFYPQIARILDNLFVVFDGHKKLLESLYRQAKSNDSHFSYDEASLGLIVNYLKKKDKELESKNKADDMKIKPFSCELSGNNYLIAMQISYDINLLMKYSDILTPKILSILFDISQNDYIIRHKGQPQDNIYMYELFLQDDVQLYYKIRELRKYSKMFCTIKNRN